MYSSIKPNTKFFIQVDRTHKLYIEECGNKKGVPVVYLHGGPGGSIALKTEGFLIQKSIGSFFLIKEDRVKVNHLNQ